MIFFSFFFFSSSSSSSSSGSGPSATEMPYPGYQRTDHRCNRNALTFRVPCSVKGPSSPFPITLTEDVNSRGKQETNPWKLEPGTIDGPQQPHMHHVGRIGIVVYTLRRTVASPSY
ncbi:hypothetical protein LZ30DRAFT_699283 [Colletotrichum cereale]|nr:hypothetical protein LZ30DRAFT_699283 [Colletotrichum cereale]